MSLTKTNLEVLADARIREASALLDLGYFSGAYYLGGYAVECGLKAIIAKNFQSEEIPDRKFVDKIYSHRLDGLVDLAGLGPSLARTRDSNPVFAENWRAALLWSETSRYEIIREDRAFLLVEAISQSENGVLAWIKSHW